MGKEIERKFLVINDDYKNGASQQFIQQGFLSTDANRVVRIRISGELAWITIKSKNAGITRAEFEYPIPKKDAVELLLLCEKPIIEKTRYKCKVGNKIWEVDNFAGENEGLVLAEVELSYENEPLKIPDWVGKEVTNDAKYYNNNLILNPFRHWKTED